jgi:hypothetical protein
MQCEKLSQQFTGFQKRVHSNKESEESIVQKIDLYLEFDRRSLNEIELANRKKNYKGSLQQWWLFGLITVVWIFDTFILVYQMNFHATDTVLAQNINGIILQRAWEDNKKVVNEVALIKLYLLNHLHGANYTYNNASLISALDGDLSEQHFDFSEVGSS